MTVEVIAPLVVFILEKDNLAAIFSSFVFDELLEIIQIFLKMSAGICRISAFWTFPARFDQFF